MPKALSMPDPITQQTQRPKLTPYEGRGLLGTNPENMEFTVNFTQKNFFFNFCEYSMFSFKNETSP